MPTETATVTPISGPDGKPPRRKMPPIPVNVLVATGSGTAGELHLPDILHDAHCMLMFLHQYGPQEGVDPTDEDITYGRQLVESTILDAMAYCKAVLIAAKQ